MTQKELLFPRARYYGEFTPEHLMFNANLQEFAHYVSITCALETGGKISPIEAIQRIEKLWEELQASKVQLGIDSRSQ